jgi:anti-sigma B factor antagonist
MTTKNSRLRMERIGDVVQVGFLDHNILEESNIQAIGEEVGLLIEQSTNPKILMNFAQVEHLSSAALGTLITISNKIKYKGGQLRLANIDAQIYEVFVITKLNKLFQIHDTTDAAVASFK